MSTRPHLWAACKIWWKSVKNNCVRNRPYLIETKSEICTSLRSDFYFWFHSPLNTKSALLNFIFTWDLVLICCKCGQQSLKTAEMGIRAPLKSANYFRFVWQTQHRVDGIKLLLAMTNYHRNFSSLALTVRVRLPICRNWTVFAILLRRYRWKSVDVGDFGRGWATSIAHFRRKGTSPTKHCGWQKTRRIVLSCDIKISPVGSLD